MNSSVFLNNPDQDNINQILNQNDEFNELKFTRNIVDVQIEGKGIPDLVVTDLPGLIQSVDEEEDKK